MKISAENAFVTLHPGEDDLAHIAAVGNSLHASTASGKLVQLAGFQQKRDCSVTSWSKWSNVTEEMKSSCSGLQVRNRTVVRAAFYGGEVCPALGQTRKYAESADCKKCSGGRIWSATPHCSATCTNPRPDCGHVIRPVCACPPERPLEFHGLCTVASWCPQAHMRRCSHVKCRLVSGKVVVQHDRLEKQGEKHYCRHSHDFLGGCHCLCYVDHLHVPELPTSAPTPLPQGHPCDNSCLGGLLAGDGSCHEGAGGVCALGTDCCDCHGRSCGGLVDGDGGGKILLP